MKKWAEVKEIESLRASYMREDASKARALISNKLQLENPKGNFAKIVEKAITLAKAGDPSARDWLTDRALGRVPQNVDVDVNKTITIDVESIEQGRKAIREYFRLNTGEQGQDSN